MCLYVIFNFEVTLFLYIRKNSLYSFLTETEPNLRRMTSIACSKTRWQSNWFSNKWTGSAKTERKYTSTKASSTFMTYGALERSNRVISEQRVNQN